MPPPRKIDLLPDDFRRWLAEELNARGFGDILDVTEALNFRLEEEGMELRLGKSSVGEYSKLLKAQRDAFSMAETLLADMDIDGESKMHKVLMQMIASAAMQMMQAVANDDEATFDPKSLASLSRMLKDLMHSAGMREKLLEDERRRVAAEARAEAAEKLDQQSGELGISRELAEAIKGKILGVAA